MSSTQADLDNHANQCNPDTQRLKFYLKRLRQRKKGCEVDLSKHPNWKQILNTYPFIHDYCNPLDAVGICIKKIETVFGKNYCPALRFKNDTFHEFSYKKIGMTEEKCLENRLRSAFNVEFTLIKKRPKRECHFDGHGKTLTWEHVPPFTFAIIKRNFLRRYNTIALSKSLVEEENVGWRLPKQVGRNFRNYHNKVATIKPCSLEMNQYRNKIMVWRKRCFDELQGRLQKL